MSEKLNNSITVSEIRTYLYSLEREKEKRQIREVHRYKAKCNANMSKPKKREIAKIERNIDKEFAEIFKNRDNILGLLDECKEIPIDIEKLQVAEYMLYRVDLRKAEKMINRNIKKLEKRYTDIQEEIEARIHTFPMLEDINEINYSEYNTDGTKLASAKEQYKLEYTEEERNALIGSDLEIVDKAIQFNSVPMPHEILKNSDRDIQSKMQKFNNIRQKRIRILTSMKDDYKKLIDPREILTLIDDALSNISCIKDVLTRNEYKTVKNVLIRKRKRIYRSTNDLRSIIESKEKKVGIQNFNIQEARYKRMEDLRKTILEASNQIKLNPIDESEEQLEKLKIAYEREKQYAYVIERLDNNRDGVSNLEVRAYEEQIQSLLYKISNSKKIIEEAQGKIKQAKQELLVLWKMEINGAVSKKKDMLELGAPKNNKTTKEKINYNKNTFLKLKKASKGKHACT